MIIAFRGLNHRCSCSFTDDSKTALCCLVHCCHPCLTLCFILLCKKILFANSPVELVDDVGVIRFLCLTCLVLFLLPLLHSVSHHHHLRPLLLCLSSCSLTSKAHMTVSGAALLNSGLRGVMGPLYLSLDCAGIRHTHPHLPAHNNGCFTCPTAIKIFFKFQSIFHLASSLSSQSAWHSSRPQKLLSLGVYHILITFCLIQFTHICIALASGKDRNVCS